MSIGGIAGPLRDFQYSFPDFLACGGLSAFIDYAGDRGYGNSGFGSDFFQCHGICLQMPLSANSGVRLITITSRNIKNAGRSRLFQQSGASSWRFIHFILMLLRSFQIVNRLLLEKDMVFMTMIDLSI